MSNHPSKRKPGAQPGNRNAYKHGLYARTATAPREPMAPPKHGFYSHNFTPEEIASLDAIPPDQYLAHVKSALLILVVDLLNQPGLSTRQRFLILKTITRFINL